MNPGTTQGFARVVDPVLLPEADRRRKKPRDIAMVEATLDELRRRRARAGTSDRRLFLWSHFIDPHAPYWDHGRFGDGEEDRYDAEVAASDRALGMLRQGLDDLGLLEEAIVVVTADHGEELGEHGTRRHSRSLWNEAMRVPLVVSVPGAPPRRIADPVSHVDLVPTLLPLLGIPAPPGLDGRSLARAVTDGVRPPERTIVLVSYPMYDRVPAGYAAVRGSRKLVTDREGVATDLYDLRADPAERDNLLDEAPASLLRALEADVSRYRTRGLGEARR
jgi:arylsulfatase A-like enzyme